MDSLAFLSQPNGKFDLAFLDHPTDGAAGKGFGNDVCGGEARQG